MSAVSATRAIGRIQELDLLRGYFIAVILIDHIQRWPSFYTYLTGQGRLWVSAAEGFFIISGLLIGYLRGYKARHHPLAVVTKKLTCRHVIHMVHRYHAVRRCDDCTIHRWPKPATTKATQRRTGRKPANLPVERHFRPVRQRLDLFPASVRDRTRTFATRHLVITKGFVVVSTTRKRLGIWDKFPNGDTRRCHAVAAALFLGNPYRLAARNHHNLAP